MMDIFRHVFGGCSVSMADAIRRGFVICRKSLRNYKKLVIGIRPVLYLSQEGSSYAHKSR